MRELFFDFEDFQTRNFAPIGTIDGVRFSPNAIALVSLDEEGEGLFNATRTSPPVPRLYPMPRRLLTPKMPKIPNR
ncbi:hypothetical protein AP9108_33835 [Arthrospira sp. PCC 9108]|nr:hypothetical protein AP9108_33835 [Arthrospira sp. PCC 9108]